MSGAILVLRDPHRETLAAAGLGARAGLLDEPVGEVEKAAVPGREIRRVDVAGRRYFVKRIRGRGAAEVEHEARVLDHLRDRGLPVAEVCAVARDGDRGALVTLGLPVTTTLEQRVVRGDPSPGRLRALADRVASLVRRLHDAGVVHRDLYVGHVLLDDDDRPHLVDLGRAELRRRIPRRRIVKDLAALDFSTPARIVGTRARLRFLLRYVGRDAPRRRVRSLAAAIARKSARIRRHAERKVARGDGNVHVNA